jgi:high-affinity iron transporter
MSSVWDGGIGAIFCREFLEGFIIISQFRSVIDRQADWSDEEKARKKKIIMVSAGAAAAFALLVVIIAGAIIAAVSNELTDKTVPRIIEGVSKCVAALCIAQLSWKIPKWLGVYSSKKGDKDIGLDDKQLRFNVGWNIWREVAEIGVFLIPSFLKGDLTALPISGLIGLAIACVPGAMIHFASKKASRAAPLAKFLAILTAWLSCGLMSGGLHEFEEIVGETADVFYLGDKQTFWDEKLFPLTLFKPFGYRRHPSVLTFLSFWFFAIFIATMHWMKWQDTKRAGGAKVEEAAVEDTAAPVEA